MSIGIVSEMFSHMSDNQKNSCPPYKLSHCPAVVFVVHQKRPPQLATPGGFPPRPAGLEVFEGDLLGTRKDIMASQPSLPLCNPIVL